MVNGISSWWNSAHSHNNPIIRNDTIVVVALGALSFFSASLFDRTAPELGAVLRILPVGLGLFWIFSRCCSKGNWHHPNGAYQSVPVVVQQPYVQPAPSFWSRHYWSSWSPSSYLPSWSSWPKRMWTAPVTRGHVPAPAPFYAQAAPTFPHVQPAPAQPSYMPTVPPGPSFSATQVHAKPHFPAVQPAPAQHHSFPQVQRAAAQPSFGTHTEAFARPSAPSISAFSSTPTPPSGGRQMFAAAKTR